MEFWLYVLMMYMPSLVESARDPMNGYLAPSAAIRNLDCEPSATRAPDAWIQGACRRPALAAIS